MHAVADEHDTPANPLGRVPPGSGVFWIVHFVPFQRKAIIDSLLFASTQYPTAMQADAEAHDTPVSVT